MRAPALTRLVAEVADLAAADVCDRFGERARVLDLPLRSFGARSRFYGPVRTVRCRDDDGLVRQILDDPGMGSVLVVDGGGSTRGALLGDRTGTVAAAQGWGGVVVFGAVRDAAQLETVGLGILATGTTPRRGGRTGRGDVDVPVTLGGVPVHPGELLVADRDGIVVLDPGRG